MIVLVTGCRSGFGQNIALRAARAGHTVYAGLRDPATAGPLVEAAAGLPLHPIALDVVNPAQREAAIARIMQEQGRIDALINNAGVAIGGPLEDLEEDEVRNVFEVNVFGVWALTNLVLPHMRAQRSGIIQNISSVSGRTALPGMGAYAASKHALEGMTEALRVEVSPFGIRVVIIEPGPYKTDILGRNRALGRKAIRPDSPYADLSARADALFAKVSASAEDPEDVAKRCVELLTDTAPALRHPMGKSAHMRLFARWALPDGVLEAIVKTALARAK
jgi:NAD(P)-dependent dehydrogenase (short-subunit alcohol dehydrogenase family)